jgi:hypothetical protein
MPRRLDSAHARHVQVHHDDVRGELADELHRLAAARRLAHDGDALLLEQVPETCAEQVVVVDDQDPERLVLPLGGRLKNLSHR